PRADARPAGHERSSRTGRRARPRRPRRSRRRRRAALPPDGAIAAGPNNLVVVVNTALKVFTKTGTLLAGPINLASFLARGSSLTIATDPFADYDPVANRFMLGALFRDLSYNSAVNIAVSGSGDP